MARLPKKKSTKKATRKAAEKPFTISKEFREAIGVSIGASLGAIIGRAYGKDPDGFTDMATKLFAQLKTTGLSALYFDGAVGASADKPSGSVPWWSVEGEPAVWNFGLSSASRETGVAAVCSSDELHAFPINGPFVSACGVYNASAGPATEGAKRCGGCEAILKVAGYDVSDLRDAKPPSSSSTPSPTPTTRSAGPRKRSRKPKTSA